MPNTSHFAIFDYWKDKMIMKNGEIVTTEEYYSSKKRSGDAIRVVYDWFEVQCWACEKIYRHEEEAQEKASESKDMFKALWSDPKVKSFYNRCHIVPQMLGGEDSPNNLFLLCPSCHVLSPDTSNPETFFRWVYRKRKKSFMGWDDVNQIRSLVEEELESRGYNNIESILETAYFEASGIGENAPKKFYDGFQKYAKSEVGFHEYKISQSSIVGIVCDYIEKLYKTSLDKSAQVMIDDSGEQCCLKI